MAFYLQPPRGKVSLEKLTNNCQQRMRFLFSQRECTNVDDFRSLCEQLDVVSNSECLIEGSKADRSTHFLLRLLCSDDIELSSFFIQAETRLFSHRFQLMSSEEQHCLFNSVDQLLSRNVCDASTNIYDKEQLKNTLEIFHNISNGRTWDEVIKLYQNGDREISFQVPFQYALKSVSLRYVPVTRGQACMTYADLPEVLTAIFEELLTAGIQVAQRLLPQVVTDERLRELHSNVKLLYSQLQRSNNGFMNKDGSLKVKRNIQHLKSDDLDEVAHSFPLCMRHLHRKLRQNHRLRHFSRIQYTLFLKEIGMPVNEAIHLWKMEYSKPHCNHGDGCSHDWSRDGKRYTYSIRHLYGMEGSFTNYKAHCCQTIQANLLGPGEEGGCPFKHFDRIHLEREVQREKIPTVIQDKLLSLSEKRMFQKACQVFLRTKILQETREKMADMENVFDEYPWVGEFLNEDGGQENETGENGERPLNFIQERNEYCAYKMRSHEPNQLKQELDLELLDNKIEMNFRPKQIKPETDSDLLENKIEVTHRLKKIKQESDSFRLDNNMKMNHTQIHLKEESCLDLFGRKMEIDHREKHLKQDSDSHFLDNDMEMNRRENQLKQESDSLSDSAVHSYLPVRSELLLNHQDAECSYSHSSNHKTPKRVSTDPCANYQYERKVPKVAKSDTNGLITETVRQGAQVDITKNSSYHKPINDNDKCIKMSTADHHESEIIYTTPRTMDLHHLPDKIQCKHSSSVSVKAMGQLSNKSSDPPMEINERNMRNDKLAQTLEMMTINRPSDYYFNYTNLV